MRVRTKPGQSTLTRTGEAAISRSRASTSERATTACLVATYGPISAGERSPAIDAVFTTCPSPCATIPGTNARTPWMTPHRLTPSVHSQSAALSVHIGPAPPPTPALLHTTCTAPKRSTARAASASTEAPSATSVRTASTPARAPSMASIAPAVSASAASSTSASTTLIPSAANLVARLLPMPLPAPVTTATLPTRSFTAPSSSRAAPRGRSRGALPPRRATVHTGRAPSNGRHQPPPEGPVGPVWTTSHPPPSAPPSPGTQAPPVSSLEHAWSAPAAASAAAIRSPRRRVFVRMASLLRSRRGAGFGRRDQPRPIRSTRPTPLEPASFLAHPARVWHASR